MAIIYSYPKNSDILITDTLVGTSTRVVNGKRKNVTKNFEIGAVATFFNENSSISIAGQNNFFFQDKIASGRKNGSISFISGGGSGTLFSNITVLRISRYATSGNIIIDFINTLVNEAIIIAQTDDLNNFGIYKFLSISPASGQAGFFDITLEVVNANGSILEDKFYGLAVYPGFVNPNIDPIPNYSFISPLVNNSDVISINQSNATTDGYLSQVDWNTFNNKQGLVTLTTTGTSGPASFVGNVLNIPNYTFETPSLLNVTAVGNTTTLDIYANSFQTNTGYGLYDDGNVLGQSFQFPSNLSYLTYIGTTFNVWQLPEASGTIALTSDIPDSITLTTTGSSGPATLIGSVLNIPEYAAGSTYVFTSPLVDTSGVISINKSDTTTNGYLSFTDWNTFNNKQDVITLTTTGTSGPATLIDNVLNIPNYASTALQNLNDVLTIGNVSMIDAYVGSNLGIYDAALGGFSVINSNNRVFTFLDDNSEPVLRSEPRNLTIFESPTIEATLRTSFLTASRLYQLPNSSGTIALTSDIPSLTGYVPYTGATSNVDLGEYQLKAGQIEFDQTPTQTPGTAKLRWNNVDGTLDLGLKGGNVTLQIGQETVLLAVNKTGTNLLESDFNAVRVRSVSEGGASGQRLAVVLAQANNDANSATTIGIVTENINNNQEGFITTSGEVREINTTGAKSFGGLETWVDGDMLFLDPLHAGYLTNVKPTAPDHLIVIGYVVYAHAIHGKIFVKVDNGYELDELHNVLISSPTNNQGIFYNDVTSLWENKTIDSALGYTPTPNSRTISTTSPLQGGGDLTGDRTLSILQSNSSQDGYLSSTDWNLFNGKQNAITLTTTGSSGPATLIGDTLNIPEYSGGGGSSFYSYKLTSPVSLTGTLTETQMLRVEIPPNTFGVNDVLNIPNLWYNKIGTAGSATFRVKMSTLSTMPTGNTDLLISHSAGGTTIFNKYYRNYLINNGNIYGISATSGLASDTTIGNTAMLTKTFNPTVTNYLYISISLGNVADTVYLRGFNMNNI